MALARLTTDADPIAALTAEVAALRARVERLEAERSSPAQRAADAELLPLLAESIGGDEWTSGELLAHATVDPRLAAALDRRLIEDERGIGCLLRRLVKRREGPIRIIRGAKVSGGRLWRCTVDPL